jgi:hypothetical protein
MKQQTLAEGVKAWATAVVKAQHKITYTRLAHQAWSYTCTCGNHLSISHTVCTKADIVDMAKIHLADVQI